MINKNINRLLSSILGVAFTIGIMEMPVLADNSVQATSSYSTNANLTENESYIVNKDNSVEENGLKIRINKIVGTKHKLKVTVIVESEKPFNENGGENVIANLTYGENNYGSESRSYEYPNDKKLVITFEKNSDDEELQEKGDLRIDVVIPKYKVNVGLDATVDFTESFKNTIEKDISAKISESDITLNKLESNILGTRIIYSEPERDYFDRDNDFADHLSSMILKVGDKMYKTQHSGSHSSNDITIGDYESGAANYDKLKDEKDISIIPIVCDITWNEMNKTNISEDNQGKNQNEETINNVTYVKSFEFSDGSKGEIYNIERTDNTVKVYCRGTSEKESLVMASNINMYYHFEEDNHNYINYDSNNNMSFYKDSKDALGYVLEFNNVEKDKDVDLNLDSMIKQIDRFKVGDEIQISK